jgi:hypothetical protein
MKFNPRSNKMKWLNIKFYFLAAALLLSQFLAADDVVATAKIAVQPLQLTLSQHPGIELLLESRQAPLDDILKQISLKSGVAINYSVLPQQTVTATCAGSTVTELLICLLGPDINLAYRFQETAKHTAPNTIRHPAEIWLLGSSLSHCQTNQAPPIAELSQLPTTLDETAVSNLQDHLIEKVQDPNPEVRAKNILALSYDQEIDNEIIQSILLEALEDSAAIVRAQAVSALVRRDADAAKGTLLQTLMDDAPDVRMKAITLINDDAALLPLLEDEDGDVRLIAETKIKFLKDQKEMATNN